MIDLTKLDFQQALIKQVLFKSRLRSILYGVRPADDSLFSPEGNPLSQWLHEVMIPRYGYLVEVNTMEDVLQQMLETGHRLVRQYQQGRIQEAREGLSQIDRYSDQITNLLRSLEQAAPSVDS